MEVPENAVALTRHPGTLGFRRATDYITKVLRVCFQLYAGLCPQFLPLIMRQNVGKRHSTHYPLTTPTKHRKRRNWKNNGDQHGLPQKGGRSCGRDLFAGAEDKGNGL